MKKKKDKYYRTDLLWIPCLIILLTFVGYIYFTINNTPEFNITKEEYSNWSYYSYCNDEVFICYNKQCYDEYGNKIDDFSYCLDDCKKKHCILNEGESYEQVEVDEIEIRYSFCKNACGSSKHCVEWCSRDVDNYITEKISKQDLSVEWLDENCEDLECNYYNLGCMKYSMRAKIPLTKEQYYDSKASGLICTDKRKECTKYKCGEYQVEVLK